MTVVAVMPTQRLRTRHQPKPGFDFSWDDVDAHTAPRGEITATG